MTLAELSGLSEKFSQTRGSVRGLSPTLQPDGEAELLLPQFPQPSDQTNSKREALCLPSLEVLTAKQPAEQAKGWHCEEGPDCGSLRKNYY